MRYSLRTLLLGMTVMGLTMGLVGPRLRRQVPMTSSIHSGTYLPSAPTLEGASAAHPYDRTTQTAVRDWLALQGFERDRAASTSNVDWFVTELPSDLEMRVQAAYDVGGSLGYLSLDAYWQQPQWFWQKQANAVPPQGTRRFCRDCDAWLKRYHAMESIMRKQRGFRYSPYGINSFPTRAPAWSSGFAGAASL